MLKKLDDLILKFQEENNNSGKRMAEAIKEYLCEFTDTLRTNVEQEINKPPYFVNKVANRMISCSSESDYTVRHFFPVVKEKMFNILSSEKNDKKVLERLNEGIRHCQSDNGVNLYGIDIGSYKYKIPAAYIYTDATQIRADCLKDKKYSLDIVDKNGKNYSLNYYLIWSDEAVSKCKKLWNMTKLYGDETPIVFAPYAKRLFRIDIDIEELISNYGIQIENIDFQLERNGLKQSFMLNQELVWNVKIEEQPEVNKRKSPFGDIVKWKYIFQDLQSYHYIVPKTPTWPTCRLNSLSENEVGLEFENEYLQEFERITIYELEEKDMIGKDIFYPRYNLKNFDKKYRVRSISDAYYEVMKFDLPEGIRLKNIQTNLPESKQIVEKYPVHMTVYDKGRFGYKNTNRLFVIFDYDDSSSSMLVDYINYILGYLTFCFPEIGWEGAI